MMGVCMRVLIRVCMRVLIRVFQTFGCAGLQRGALAQVSGSDARCLGQALRAAPSCAWSQLEAGLRVQRSRLPLSAKPQQLRCVPVAAAVCVCPAVAPCPPSLAYTIAY
jgi:hypothetical protein